jgi:predicted TIM-barrel fold metal-dependent hydrolase
MGFLTEDDYAQLVPADYVAARTPIPMQVVASDEYMPEPQSPAQREVQARLYAMADDFGRKQGFSRRRFFQSAAGMAAAFVAMNETYGNVFAASRAEAAMPDMAQTRADALRSQLILDMHTHFLRDDTRLEGFVKQRESVGDLGWNPQLKGKPQTLADLKFDNYFKEIYLDSDTKIALISSSPSEIPQDWFLTNQMMADARRRVNERAGSKRMFAHAIFTPGMPGWLDDLDAALELQPDSMKGYTIGDNTHKDLARHPWRMDDERVTYLGYEKMVKAGQKIVCVHKGLFPPSTEKSFPNLTEFAAVGDVGKAARDWPQLTFVIYHGGYRHVGGSPADAWSEFERTGRSAWVSDLAEVPEKYGVTNVYADVGQLFAHSTVAQPKLAAALMGILIKGLGADRVNWGTDAVWTGAPQWQIEGLRRMEIPEDMQKQYGFTPLGAADGPVKTAIFSGNSARLYGIDTQHAAREIAGDQFASIKQEYLKSPSPSLRYYGYVPKA